MTRKPLFTAFYTLGTIYEREADRLRRSLDRHGLEHDIRAVADRGDWVANTKQTAAHICTMLAAYPDRPVVQLDADAVVWSEPVLFDLLGALPPESIPDVAVHYRRGRELLNGTVWFNCTDGARMVAQKYFDLIQAHPGCANEQTLLAAAIDELADLVRVHRLPPEYCWIHDIMKDDLGDGVSAVIEHLQCSRECHPSHLTENRRRRLAELQLLGVETP